MAFATWSSERTRASRRSIDALTRIDRRFDTMDRRFDALDDKISRQFMWVVGIQVTILVAVVGALLARA